MKVSTKQRTAILAALASNDATVEYIAQDLKASAQSTRLSGFSASVKKEMAKGRNVVLIAISMTSVVDFGK
jgi:hypothetical protein